jgi:hypothetical protein
MHTRPDALTRPDQDVEAASDPTKPTAQTPNAPGRAGETPAETIVFRIRQPRGRALLIAVHL